MGVLLEAEQIFLPATDDGVLGPIDISVGFPFGSSNQTQVYVSRATGLSVTRFQPCFFLLW